MIPTNKKGVELDRELDTVATIAGADKVTVYRYYLELPIRGRVVQRIADAVRQVGGGR